MSQSTATDQLFPRKISVPNPGGVEQTWSTSPRDGQYRFYTKRWYPTSAQDPSQEIRPKATILFLHGFVEYIDRYREIFTYFPNQGIEVVAFDQRGWGETCLANLKGKANYGNTTWPQQFQDIQDILLQQRKRLDEKWGTTSTTQDQPGRVEMFLVGQSMGGGLTCGFFTRPKEFPFQPSEEAKASIKGAIALAPWLKLTEEPNPLLVWVGNNILAKIPGMPWSVKLDGEALSRDPVVAQAMEKDPLCSKKVYLKAIQGPLKGGGEMVEKDYRNWRKGLPLLILHGTGDKVTSYKASVEMVEKLTGKAQTSSSGSKADVPVVIEEDCEVKLFEGFYHDLLGEPEDDKIKVAQSMVEWILKRV
ncbi:alpha/beta-hydrolase [Violaceomyces palustris]|uniref:Alpha/beta-hydrolase n=1 Tax=Violaceomyces palustris TaxID=1673888 RepID=A0ACD0NTD2_9BASI|nr:alpha/beta-hydrolase [Violaceomyces palustris]